MSTSNTKKLTSYFISNQTQHQTMESAEADKNIPSIQLDPDLNHNSESDFDMIAIESNLDSNSNLPPDSNESADPGKWTKFSLKDTAYWIDNGPSNCQNQVGPFDASIRIWNSGDKEVKRSFSESNFYGTKANGESFKREWLLYSPSKGSIYCFVCKLFESDAKSQFTNVEGFSDWKNNYRINAHESSLMHKDSMLEYLTRRKGLGTMQKL